MPDDIEVLKLRAKAKAKAQRERETVQTPAEAPQTTAGQRIANAYLQPRQIFKQGMSQIESGSPVAGGINMLTGALNAPFAPLAAGVQGLRELPKIGSFDPGGGLANVISFPPWLIGKAIEGGQNLIGGILREQPSETGQALGGLNQTLGQILFTPSAIQKSIAAPASIGRGLSMAGQKLMGTALKAGENIREVKNLSRFATERGITMTPKGSEAAGAVESNLKTALYKDILEPLTIQGKTIDPAPFKQALETLKEKIADGVLVGGQQTANILTRMGKELDAKLGGKPTLTPLEAQAYKERMNWVLEKFYNKKSAEGRAPLDAIKNEGMGVVNNAARKALEELHPEIKGINWERGSALEVKKAIDAYLLQKAKGGGEKSEVTAALRFKPSALTSFSIYDLLGSRSFRSKMAVLLDKVGRGLEGRDATRVQGVQNPVKP